MPEIVPYVLVTGMAVCAGLFRFLPGREAALIALVGGWLLLPVAPFPNQVFAQPIGHGGSMHALAVPTGIWLNKATMIGIGCLLGVLLFDAGAVRRLRFSRLDLPMAVWCAVPIASALANRLPLAEGLSQSRYLALSWGVPYLLGRAYFGDNESLVAFGKSLTLAGLVVAPLELAEVVFRPFLYDLLYGPHPYQWEGSARAILSRPMLFFEHGNQLGMWVATAAVAAVWLWSSGRLRATLGMPGGLASAALVGVCVLCQSLTGILLMAAAAVPPLLARGVGARRPRVAGAAAAVALFAGFVLAAEAAPQGDVGGMVRDAFRGIDKQSFNWRVARTGEHVATAAARPALGWGVADWSSSPGHGFVNPVNLGIFLLAFGQYGAAGLAALALAVAVPVAQVVRWLPPRAWLNPACAGVTLAAVLLAINAADGLLNSEFLLPALAGAGGVTSWSLRRYEGA